MEIALIAFIVVVTIICFMRHYSGEKDGELGTLQPFSNPLMTWGALVLAAIVILGFVVLYGRPMRLDNNIGQIGDFVGGLVNPILGFLGLLVLLRTSLLQTVELRKTTELMVEQKRIMERERIDTSFHKLLDRYEVRANKYLREIQGDRVFSRVKLNELMGRREELKGLSPREEVKKIRSISDEVFALDKLILCFEDALKVFNVVFNSGLTEREKDEYYSVFFDALEPAEAILLLSYAFVNWKLARRRFKKHLSVANYKQEFFISDLVYNYYAG